MLSDKKIMAAYLRLMISVALILCLLPFIALALFEENINVPPPRVSNSVSLNEKVLWLSQNIKHGCDILAIGSSMTLNNISTSAIYRHFPENTYINAASWGMNIRHTRVLLEQLLDYCKPKLVIIASSPVDFQIDSRPDEIYSAKMLNYMLNRRPLIQAHLTGFTLDYYKSNLFNIAKQRQRRDIYDSLAFDSGGGVPFNDSDFQINKTRWMAKHILSPDKMDDNNYSALSMLADSMQSRGVHLILVQPPLRTALIDESILEFLNNHWMRIQEIASMRNIQFLNLGVDPRFSDSDFVDAGHLNASGSGIFTDIILESIKQ